jgi:hypothetical protein
MPTHKNKKCGQCGNLAKSPRFKNVGACMVRTAGIDWHIKRHVGDRACLLFKDDSDRKENE